MELDLDWCEIYLDYARLLLKESERLLEEARLINDSVEGWYYTKEKPFKELEL